MVRLDPDAYFDCAPSQLTWKQRKQLRRNLKDSVYMTFDDFSKIQDNSPVLWLDQFHQNMSDNGVNPDHAIAFLRDEHLGTKTAMAMANWMASNRGASWSAFREAFLRLNPSKPPQVTRLTWKALSMHKSGSYHAYLTEFNRQKALISTGPDEVIEQFLMGLTASLRSQVEFLKNRNWQGDEYEQPVNSYTERVNSSVHAPATEGTNKVSSNRAQKRNFSELSAGPSRQSKPQGSNRTAGRGGPPRQNRQGRQSRQPYVGHTIEQSMAICNVGVSARAKKGPQKSRLRTHRFYKLVETYC